MDQPDEAFALHELAVKRDLALLHLPAPSWPKARVTPDGSPIYNVVIAGAGMCGIAAAGALMFRGITNILVVDSNGRGREGPWLTYARNAILRSPKHLTGPALGIPSLSFRAWYEARFGLAAWEALYKIPNGVWVAYLSWLQHVLALPVRHGERVVSIEAKPGYFALTIDDGSTQRIVHARRIVLATGRAGAGGFYTPEFMDPALWPDLAAHGNEPIAFERLKGKKIAVIGSSAAGFDNAAVALESGVESVSMFVRRKALPQVNKGRGSTLPSVHYGWGHLDDARRWALFVYLNDNPAPPPHESVHRVLHHPGFSIRFGEQVKAVRRAGDQALMSTSRGLAPEPFDFVISATGFRVDAAKIPELRGFAGDIACWADIYEPPAELKRPALGRYPYLGRGYELMAKPGLCRPDFARIHLFNYGAHGSHGAIASDIPGTSIAADRLADAIAAAFFSEDFETVFQQIVDFDEPELETTPYFVPKSER